MSRYLSFATLGAVLTAVFACVVLRQLILAELLELVSHGFLQTHRQGVAEALETQSWCLDRTVCIRIPLH